MSTKVSCDVPTSTDADHRESAENNTGLNSCIKRKKHGNYQKEYSMQQKSNKRKNLCAEKLVKSAPCVYMFIV